MQEKLINRRHPQKNEKLQDKAKLEMQGWQDVQGIKVSIQTKEWDIQENDVEDELMFEIMDNSEGKDYLLIRFDNQLEGRILNELKKDGLIADDSNFSFELTRTAFKVNNKKQPASVARKYRTLYETISGQRLNSTNHIQYKNINCKSRKNLHSSGGQFPKKEQQYSYYFSSSPRTGFLKITKPKQIEGLETLRMQLAPVTFINNLIKTT